MKSLYLSLVLIFSAAISAIAQAPEKFNYQAIVRNTAGTVVANQAVGVRVSILQGSIIGPAVFVETHTPSTNNYGLINLQIGGGTNVGPQLNTIDWSSDTYFVRIEIDPAGGSAYSLTSSSQLISVPYALHAKTAEFVDDADADPTNEYLTNVSLSGTNLNITDDGGTHTVDLVTLVNDADANPTNEIQTLSKVGSVISLSLGGGAITDDVNDADANPTNEIQTISKIGSTISLSLGGGSITDAVNDADASPTNEIQTISKVGNTVTLSLGGGSFTDAVDDADPSPTNELQTISKVGNTVTLSNGGGSFIDAVDDADASPTNELQTLTLVGSDLSISGGNTITLGGGTDSQVLSIVGNDISISNGNTITIPGNTDSQTLSIVGSDISISGGNTITIPGSTDSQTLSLVGTNLTITGGNTVNLVSLQDGVTDADADPSNEIQSLSIVGSNLTISGGNTVALPSGTDSQTLSLAGGDLTISGGNTVTLPVQTHFVGEHFGGGIIVFVDSTGQHGLICAYADLPGTYEFESTSIIAGNSAAIVASSFFDGAANTAALTVAGFSGDYVAAQACADLVSGGFSDWYLPSLYELQLLQTSSYILGQYALFQAAASPTTYHWSSTELSSNGTNAWRAQVGNGFAHLSNNTSETSLYFVRPVRKF